MKSYFTKARIARAAELLRATGAPVKTIAAMVGYDDALYFSRAFRAARGVSPSDDRRSGPLGGDDRGAAGGSSGRG